MPPIEILSVEEASESAAPTTNPAKDRTPWTAYLERSQKQMQVEGSGDHGTGVGRRPGDSWGTAP